MILKFLHRLTSEKYWYMRQCIHMHELWRGEIIITQKRLTPPACIATTAACRLLVAGSVNVGVMTG
jgi:hypothetical protein